MLIVLIKIFKSWFKQKEQVLTFAELMIRVNNSGTVEELEEIYEYFIQYQTHYKGIEQSFAKEHLIEKIRILKNQYISEIKKVTS